MGLHEPFHECLSSMNSQGNRGAPRRRLFGGSCLSAVRTVGHLDMVGRSTPRHASRLCYGRCNAAHGIEGMGRRTGPTTSYYRAVAGRAALCRAAQAEHEHKHEHKTVRTGVWEGATRPARALRPGVNFLASRQAIGWAAASLRRTTYNEHQVDSVWFVCPIVGPWAEGSNGRSGRRNGVR